MQDALDIPVHGVPFDEVAVMVYQTTYAEATGSWVGPSLVTSYAADAVDQFGTGAVMALGIIGTVGIFGHEHGYADPGWLAVDIAAARAEGIERIEVYSLDGMVESGDVEAWLTAEPTDEPVPDSPTLTMLTRTMSQNIDEVLDSI